VLVATQLFGKHIFAAVNQHATVEKAVFSVGAAPRLYNEDLTQLELELRESPELAVGRIIEKENDCYESVARKRLAESVID
jgi:hypothetical protein